MITFSPDLLRNFGTNLAAEGVVGPGRCRDATEKYVAEPAKSGEYNTKNTSGNLCHGYRSGSTAPAVVSSAFRAAR